MSDALRIAPGIGRELGPVRPVTPDTDRRAEAGRTRGEAWSPAVAARREGEHRGNHAPFWPGTASLAWSLPSSAFLAQAAAAIGDLPSPTQAHTAAASYEAASSLLVQLLGHEPPLDISV